MPGGPESPVLGGVEYKHPAAAWSPGSSGANVVTATFAQVQSFSRTGAVAAAKALTVGQTPTLKKAVQPAAWALSQAQSLATAVTQVIVAPALVFTQATALAVQNASGKLRSLTQGQAFTRAAAVSASRVWAQPQTRLLGKAVAVSRAWSQASALTWSEVRLLTLAFTQAAAAATSRRVGKFGSWAQDGSLVATRGVARTVAWAEAVSVAAWGTIKAHLYTVAASFAQTSGLASLVSAGRNVETDFEQQQEVVTPVADSWTDTGAGGSSGGGVHRTPAAPDGERAATIGGRL